MNEINLPPLGEPEEVPLLTEDQVNYLNGLYVQCMECTWYGTVKDSYDHIAETKHIFDSDEVYTKQEFNAKLDVAEPANDKRWRNFMEWLRGKSFESEEAAREVYDLYNDRPL